LSVTLLELAVGGLLPVVPEPVPVAVVPPPVVELVPLVLLSVAALDAGVDP